MEWHAFESAAPELSSKTRETLARHRVVMLATIRPDGAPRISAVEPFFIADRLVLGLMPWSAKARDLARDPRYELHNPVTDVEGSEGDVRLGGRAVPIDREDLGAEDGDAWWAGLAADRVRLVSLDIERVTSVTWDIAAGQMMTERWTSAGGVNRLSRSYP